MSLSHQMGVRFPRNLPRLSVSSFKPQPYCEEYGKQFRVSGPEHNQNGHSLSGKTLAGRKRNDMHEAVLRAEMVRSPLPYQDAHVV
jgi:hypothetical protein